MSESYPAGTTVGLIAMSAKPYHGGHHMLIERAASENDQVIVFVSTSDRKRKGELPISGQTMTDIWHKYLEDIMPENVNVEYGGSPVLKIYEHLGHENERFETDDHDIASYTVYSDPNDIAKNFPEKNMEKYLGDIWNAGLVHRQPIERTSTVNISGGQMRGLIAKGSAKRFKDLLPDPLDDDAREDIWRLLGGQS